MTAFSKFMSAALARLGNLDDAQRAPSPHRPPVFVRTNWLFVEIDEALTTAAAVNARVKIARIEDDVAETHRLIKDLRTKVGQLAQLVIWADEQFQKEIGDAS